MLRISINENEEKIEITLEGRLAGPWAAELSRAWGETAPQLSRKKLILDLRNITYTDTAGIEVLRAIYSESYAELITDSVWAEYLAKEIKDTRSRSANEEVEHASYP